MSEPGITVKKLAYYVPISVVGRDEQGRTLVICPHCHDEAYVAEDGRVVCALAEAEERLMADALARFDV